MFGTFSGEGLGFGLAFSLFDYFTAPAKAIGRQMSQLIGDTDSLAKKVNGAFGKIQAGAAMVLTGLSIAAPLIWGVKIEAEFERARLGLETLLKSKIEADKVFEQTAKDAAATPFELQPLLMVNKAIISTGISAKEARLDTLALANAIAATGGGNPELQRMAINMKQIKDMGKASAVDIKQFAIAGISIYQLLADVTGKSVAEASEMEVTYELLSVALRKAAEAGGMYEGALEKLSKSAYGKLSSISDNVQLTFAELGKVVLEMLHPILDLILTSLDFIREFMQSTAGKIVAGILTIAIALVSLSVIVLGLKIIFAALWTTVWPLLVALAPILIPILAVASAIILIKNAIDKFNDSSLEAIGKADGLRRVFLQLGGIFRGIYEIWSSIDFSKGKFSINQSTFDKLKALGLDQFVVNLGTWLVRLKAFFKGFIDGLRDVYRAAAFVASAIYNAIATVLSLFGVDMAKFTANVDSIILVGKILAYVVGSLLVGAFIAWGISMLPELLILGAIILVGWLLWEVFMYIIEAINWMMNSSNPWAQAMRAALEIILLPFTALFYLIEGVLDLMGLLGEEMDGMDGANINVKPMTNEQLGEFEAKQRAEFSNPQRMASDRMRPPEQAIRNVIVLDGKVVANSVNKVNNEDTNAELYDQ